jgi:hypothetical protein
MLGEAQRLDALVAGGLDHFPGGRAADVAMKIADDAHAGAFVLYALSFTQA